MEIPLGGVEDGITPWGPMARAGRKGTGIDEESLAQGVVDGDMGVAVDDAVGLREEIPHPFFHGLSDPCPMAEPNTKAVDLDQLGMGQGLSDRGLTHIAMNGMDLFSCKGVQDGEIDKITGMEDDGAVSECLMDLPYKPGFEVVDMGVRKDTDRGHEGGAPVE